MRRPNFEKIEEHVATIPNNDHYVKRYIKFVKYAASLDTSGEDVYHNHHILPRSMFPDLVKEKWNIVRVTPRVHYIMHWMLARAYGGSMGSAFFQMSIHPKYNIRITSSQYQEATRMHSERISGTKFYMFEGKVRRFKEDDQRVLSGEATPYKHVRRRGYEMESLKGTCVAYDTETGERKRVNVDDIDYERYIPTGALRDEDSRKKTSDALSGRVRYTNGDTVSYIKDGDKIPEGFYVWEATDEYREKVSKRVSDTTFFHNPETGECIRLDGDDPIPDGFKKGRANNFKNHFSESSMWANPLTGETESHDVGVRPPRYRHHTAQKYYFAYSDGDTKYFSSCADTLCGKVNVLDVIGYTLKNNDYDKVFNRGVRKGKSLASLGFSKVIITEWNFENDNDWFWL